MGGTAFHQREDGLTRFGIRLPNAGPITGDEQPEEATMVPVAQATS
jgi:hypothetical protein